MKKYTDVWEVNRAIRKLMEQRDRLWAGEGSYRNLSPSEQKTKDAQIDKKIQNLEAEFKRLDPYNKSEPHVRRDFGSFLVGAAAGAGGLYVYQNRKRLLGDPNQKRPYDASASRDLDGRKHRRTAMRRDVKNSSRKRIVDSSGSTIAYLTGRRAELTKQGAKWWDRSISWNSVREPIFELATRLGHALEVTYNGRSVSTVYPHAQHAGNPNFHAGMRDAKRSKARGKSSRDTAYEIVDKNGNLLATSPNFGRALSKANDYAESSRLRPVTVKQGQKTVATSWGYQKERLSRDTSEEKARMIGNSRYRYLPYQKLTKADQASVIGQYPHKSNDLFDEDYYYPVDNRNRLVRARRVLLKTPSSRDSSAERKRLIQTIYRPTHRDYKLLGQDGTHKVMLATDSGHGFSLTTLENLDTTELRRLVAKYYSRHSRDASPRCRVGTEVQSVILDNQFFSRAQAKGWIERHGFQAKKIDTTDDSFRFRQHEPSGFVGGSFRTITLRPGVKAVIGCPR